MVSSGSVSGAGAPADRAYSRGFIPTAARNTRAKQLLLEKPQAPATKLSAENGAVRLAPWQFLVLEPA